MKRLLAATIIMLGLCSYGLAATYYIDNSATGCGGGGCSDTNNGTSLATAFKHHPYMYGWTAAAAHYTHHAGDVFIFHAGDTWGPTELPLLICSGGSAGNLDVYETDGASGSVIFDGQYTDVGNRQNTYGCGASPKVYGSLVYIDPGAQYVDIEGINVTHMVSERNQSEGLIRIGGAHATVNNTTLSGWNLIRYNISTIQRTSNVVTIVTSSAYNFQTMGESVLFVSGVSCDSSLNQLYFSTPTFVNSTTITFPNTGSNTSQCTDGQISAGNGAFGGVYIAGNSVLMFTTFTNNLIFNTDFPGYGQGMLNKDGTYSGNIIHDTVTGFQGISGDIHDNTLYNISYPVDTFDHGYPGHSYHQNWAYIYPGPTGGTLSGNYTWFYRNIGYNVGSGTFAYVAPCDGSLTPSTGGHIALWSNLFIAGGIPSSGQTPVNIEPENCQSGNTATVDLVNNTEQVDASQGHNCFTSTSRSFPVSAGRVENNHCISDSGFGTLTNITQIGGILTQTNAVANGQGYTATNEYAPALGGSTIGAGTDASAYFSGLGVASPTDLLKKVIVAPWDIGAYQYQGPPSYTLTVTAAHASVVSDVGGINCVDNTGTCVSSALTPSTVVTLVATPDSGYSVTGCTGCDSWAGLTGPTTLTTNKSVTITTAAIAASLSCSPSAFNVNQQTICTFSCTNSANATLTDNWNQSWAIGTSGMQALAPPITKDGSTVTLTCNGTGGQITATSVTRQTHGNTSSGLTIQ